MTNEEANKSPIDVKLGLKEENVWTSSFLPFPEIFWPIPIPIPNISKFEFEIRIRSLKEFLSVFGEIESRFPEKVPLVPCI